MRKVRLGDIGKIVTGNTPSKKNFEYYRTKDICFFKPSDINDYEITRLNVSEEYISKKAREKVRILPKNTVLVTCIGTIGKVGILEKEACCNQQINAIIPYNNINPQYLAYIILNKKEWLQKKANAPVVPIINKTNFENIKIFICDLEEQNIIVNNLNKIQEMINIRKKQIDELDKLIESQFIKMFRNMEKCKLRDLSIITMGQSPNSSTYNDNEEGIPFFQGKADFGDTYVEINHYCSKPIKIAEIDDVLISVRAPVGAVNITNTRCCIGRGLASIRFIYGKSTKWFLYYALKAIKQEIEAKGTGSTFKAIDKDNLCNLEIPRATIEKQNLFVTVADQIDKQKNRLKKSLREMKELQESLMNKYFG